MCEDGAGDHISRIDEPESCGYIVTVQTTRICHHPYLKTPAKSKPVSITCSPALSQEEYDEYHAQAEADRLAREAAVLKYREKMQQEAEELKKMHDGKEAGKDGDSVDDLMARDEVNSDQWERKSLADSITKGFQDALNEYGLGGEQDMDNLEVNLRFIEDPADVRKVMNEMLRDQQSKVSKMKNNNEIGKDAQTSITNQKDTNQIKASSKKLKEYVVEDTDEKKSAYYARESEDVDDVNDNVDEEEADDPDGSVQDKDDELLQEFGKGVDKIAPRSAQKARLSKFKDVINSAMQAQFNDIVEETQQELANEGVDTTNVDKAETYKRLSETLTKLLETLDETKTKNGGDKSKDQKQDAVKDQKQDAVKDSAKPPQSDESSSESSSKTTDSQSMGNSGGDGSNAAITQTRKSQPLEDSKQTIEGTVKETVEKVAVNTQGRKVEVRIVTAAYYNDKDGTVHMVTGGDSDNIDKMMFAILGSNDDELREAKRQQQIENAYNFKWNGKKSKESKPES